MEPSLRESFTYWGDYKGSFIKSNEIKSKLPTRLRRLSFNRHFRSLDMKNAKLSTFSRLKTNWQIKNLVISANGKRFSLKYNL